MRRPESAEFPVVVFLAAGTRTRLSGLSRGKVDSEIVEVVGGAALAQAGARSRKEATVTGPDPPQPEAEASRAAHRHAQRG